MVKAPTSPADVQDRPQETAATQSLVFDVGGMKCAGCVRAVENQLTACDGVHSATVNLITEVAVVETAARAEAAVAKHLGEKPLRKVIYVADRLINMVV